MEEEQIRQLFEEIDPGGKIPPERIEEFIAAVKDIKEHPLKDGDKVGDYTISIGNLEEQLRNETDWKKKASLAAQIISRNLE